MKFSTLNDATVIHKQFGQGKVVEIGNGNNRFFTVEFEKGDCHRFEFPEAFTKHYLTFNSENNSTETEKAMSIRERLLWNDGDVLKDMADGKYRINYDFGEATSLIPPLSVLNSYVPTEVFWDLVIKIEHRVFGKIIPRMDNPNLSVSEILGNDYLNIYLTGEPGTGKNALIEALCSVFGFPLSIINLSANIEEDTFTGTNKVYDGRVMFCETPFLKAYKYGGVILLDEINAVNPSVTITLNDALIKPFKIYENNLIPRHRHPLCIIAAASNPTCNGIYPLNEAMDRRFNVTKVIEPLDRESMIKHLSREYPEPMVRWVYDAYEKCKVFLKDREADEVYRVLSIDSVIAVLNDLEEGRNSIKSLDNFTAKASTRDPELAKQMQIFCNSMAKFETNKAGRCA